MKLVDNLKILVLFLGVIHFSPVVAVFDNIPCVIAALAGFLAVAKQLDDVREEEERECQQRLADLRRAVCTYFADLTVGTGDNANIQTCIDCISLTTADTCTNNAACRFQDGYCGPNTGIVQVP